MKNSLETKLGIFVVLAVLAVAMIIEIVGIEKFQPGYHLHALFSNVQDLKVGDLVKMAGVEVGRVEKIQLAEAQGKVNVTMKLRRDALVRTDSTATIRFTGLMGQNYVSIDFGSATAPALQNNQFVNTAEQPDLNQLMAKLDSVATGVQNITKNFTGDTINNLLGPFTDFLKANREPLTASIANMQSISSKIASGQGTIGKLIYDQTLYNSALGTVSNLQNAATAARGTLASAQDILQQVNAGKGTAGKLVKDEALYNETTASMKNLREILQKINKGQGTVGKLVNDQEFYKNAKLSLQKLDKATEGLEDQGPLSVVGIAINTLL